LRFQGQHIDGHPVDVSANRPPDRQLEAVQRLCNTDSTRRGQPTLCPCAVMAELGEGRIKSGGSSYLTSNARMAKSADAADLKSAGRKAVGVQVPLWAPSESAN
jgi:hypothetical protein